MTTSTAEKPMQTVQPGPDPHKDAAGIPRGPGVLRFKDGVYLYDGLDGHKFTTAQLAELRDMINDELAGAGNVNDYTEAERLAGEYADRLRAAGFDVDLDVTRKHAQPGFGDGMLPPSVTAGMEATKEGYRLRASWTTTLKARSSTKFNGVSFGSLATHNFQPREAKSIGDLDALIDLDELSQWQMLKGFNRGER